jgi:hypothetical protein
MRQGMLESVELPRDHNLERSMPAKLVKITGVEDVPDGCAEFGVTVRRGRSFAILAAVKRTASVIYWRQAAPGWRLYYAAVEDVHRAAETLVAGTSVRPNTLYRPDWDRERRWKASEEYRQLLDKFRWCYPAAPEGTAEKVIDRAFAPGSECVGTQEHIHLKDRIDMATRAYVRHQLTDYDQRMERDEDRDDARTSIKDQVDEILDRWLGL